jgi:hypothetical protein
MVFRRRGGPPLQAVISARLAVFCCDSTRFLSQDERMKAVAVLLSFALLWSGSATAQGQRNCVSATSLQLQPIIVVPEAGFFSYRLQVFNAGGGPRNFSYHFPLPLLMPTPGAVYAFNIRPRQTISIQLGTTQERATDAALRQALRITCHS